MVQMCIIPFKINGAPLGWLSFDYSFDFSSSRLALDGTNVSWLGSLVNEVALNIIPHKKREGRISGDYFRNELSTDCHKDVFLLDAKMIYKINKRMSVSASLHNIFNHRTYNYTTYRQLSSCESMRWLRGRELLISFSISK